MLIIFCRFKQLKEQEARKRQQREEEKRKAEIAANKKEDKPVEIENSIRTDSVNGDSISKSLNASTSEYYRVVNGDSASSEVKEDEISDDHNRGVDQHISDERKKVKFALLVQN